MRTTKEIALACMFTALLIGGQWVLSFAVGVEIVTVLLLSFVYRFGIRRGIVVATAFSTLRCLVFGFFPTVLILYLVYYNLFAVFGGWIGNGCRHRINGTIHKFLTMYAAFMTVCFSLLDDVITPLYYGFTPEATQAYFFNSILAMVPQTVCAIVTVGILLRPLLRAYKTVRM